MPEIDRRVSLGNLLTIAALLIPALMAWGALQAQSTSQSEQLQDHEQRIRILENTLTGSLARIDARLSQIEKELSK